MTHVGIDLHKRESQVCLMNEKGEVVKEMRIASRRDAMTKALKELAPGARVLLESSTSSEWVARHLESFGFEVVVADPNYAPMMGSRRKRKVKTDRRDARALAEASRLGAFKKAHRMSDEDRVARGSLGGRALLVGARTKLINFVRAQVLQYGEPLQSCAAEHLVARVREASPSEELMTVLTPILAVLEKLDAQIASVDKKLERQARKNPTARKLTTVGGVGPITTLAFMAVVGRPQRFQSAGHVSSYIGLVPGEDSSGDGVRRTRITKTGNSYLRSLLVGCAQSLMRSKDGGGLAQWGRRLAKKRGKRLAAVALARRLARILWAMWRDDTVFDPAKCPERKLEAQLATVTD